MTAPRDGARWRLLLGTIAFAVWGPPSLLGLPLAGLLVAAGPRQAKEWGAVAAVGLPSLGLLLLPAGGLLAGVVRAYTVLVTAAFVLFTALPRGEGWDRQDGRDARFLRVALRASLVAGAAAVLLAT